MENPSESTGEDQEQQISLFDPTKRYPVVNPDLLQARQAQDRQSHQLEPEMPQPRVQHTASLQQLRHWYKAAQVLGKDDKYLNRIADLAKEVAAGHELPDKAQVAMEQDLALYQSSTSQQAPSTPAHQQPAVTLDRLRSWYAAARELNKDAAYLERITAIAEAFKQGQPLSAKASAAMQQDIQAVQSIAEGKQL